VDETTTQDAGPSARCGAGMREVKTACVPVFSDCKSDEVPILGGGCKRVGVEECKGGLKAPPDWKCKRVGPPEKCATGWSMTSDGGCEPALPAAACPAGKMAVLGKSACQPIMACGSGTYGDIKTTASTIYVDAASTASTPDGSLARPYKTLHMALHGASAGAHIAVAAGAYKSDVTLSKAVTIDGRCPEMVSITNATSKYTATVVITGPTATLRGVTITGDQRGFNIYEHAKVVLERVAITSCKSKGIYAINADVKIRDSLLSGNINEGIKVYGATVSLERSVVRDTSSDATKKYGYGISGAFSSIFKKGAALTITDSLITGNMVAGVILFNSSATISRSVISKTRVRGLDSDAGTGLTVLTQAYPSGYTGKKEGGVLTLKDSLLAENSFGGINIHSGTATVSGSVIRDSKVAPGAAIHNGAGITVSGLSGLAASLTLKDSLLLRNYCDGVGVIFGTAEISGTRIQDTRVCSDGKGGRGIFMESNPDLKIDTSATIKDSILSGNHSAGLASIGGKFTMERTLVKGTLPDNDGKLGLGLEVNAFHTMSRGSVATIRDSRITGSRYAGIYTGWSTLDLERSIVTGTRFQKFNNLHGYGLTIWAYKNQTSRPSKVTVKESLISDNQTVGIHANHSIIKVEGSRVDGTATSASYKGLGYGVHTWEAQLSMDSSLVQKNHSAGVAIKDSTQNTITRSALLSTGKDGQGVHGSGLTVIQDKKKAGVTAKDNQFKSNHLAGLVFFGGAGAVSRSLFESNDFSIALDSGASPSIGEDNVYTGNKRDTPSFGVNLKQPATPSPPEIGASTKK